MQRVWRCLLFGPTRLEEDVIAGRLHHHRDRWGRNGEDRGERAAAVLRLYIVRKFVDGNYAWMTIERHNGAVVLELERRLRN